MGGCESDEIIEIQPNKNRNLNDYNGPDQHFPDMKEWKGDRYKGIGIKKMKGYICDLPIDKLNKKREEFWKAKFSENYIWKIIQQACVFDEYRANLTLEKYKMRTAEGCINHIIDQIGNHYYIPNYCINDPYFEKELCMEDENDKENVNLILYESSQNLTKTIKISNHATGQELKEKFREEAKIKKKKYKLRLFFSGSEIKDDHLLFQHKLKDDFIIQVMKVKIE